MRAALSDGRQHTAVVVAYRTRELDLSFLPDGAPVVVVHNDTSLDRNSIVHEPICHLYPGRNLGFGAGVNLALSRVETPRVLLVNPDVTLSAEHWAAFERAEPLEVLTVALLDLDGVPTSVVNRYPTPAAMLLTGLRVGRLLRRGSVFRAALTPFLGSWGRAHAASLALSTGSWPLLTHWPSAAAVSYPTSWIVDVGGFDEEYFLYFEDIDLAARVAALHPEAVVTVASTPPAVHTVSASSSGSAEQATVARHHLRSAVRYCAKHNEMRWRMVKHALELRLRTMRSG